MTGQMDMQQSEMRWTDSSGVEHMNKQGLGLVEAPEIVRSSCLGVETR